MKLNLEPRGLVSINTNAYLSQFNPETLYSVTTPKQGHLLWAGINRRRAETEHQICQQKVVYIQGYLFPSRRGFVYPRTASPSCQVLATPLRRMLAQLNNPVKGTNVLQKSRSCHACFLLTDIHL